MKTSVRWIIGFVALILVVVGVLKTTQSPVKEPEHPQAEAVSSSVQQAKAPDATPGAIFEPADKARPLARWFSEQQAAGLLTKPLPANSYTLDALSGTVRSADGERALKGERGSFERILIREGESISITLQLPDLRPGREVVVAASNGGRIERRGGPLAFVARSSAEVLDLAFTPTLGRGAYSIDVRHSGAVATLAFWAGPQFPTGEPGPDFTPLPTTSEVIP